MADMHCGEKPVLNCLWELMSIEHSNDFNNNSNLFDAIVFNVMPNKANSAHRRLCYVDLNMKSMYIDESNGIDE